MNDLLGFEALIRSASKDVLTPDEQRLLLRERVPDVREVAWTDADLPLLDEADAILGPKSAARPRRRRRGPAQRGDGDGAAHGLRARSGGSVSAEQVLERYGYDTPAPRRRGRRRPAHLRARARRRGAGSHRHAVAHARPPLPVGFDDAGRRLRPGEPHRRPRELGRRAQERHRAGAAAPRDALGELPHSERDHGGREPAAARGRARRGARPLGPQHRRGTRWWTRSGPRISSTPRPARVRAALPNGGTVAVIAPPDLHDAAHRRARAIAARSPIRSKRSTRRSRCCHRSTPRASSSTTSSSSSPRVWSPPTPPACACSTSCSPHATRQLVGRALRATARGARAVPSRRSPVARLRRATCAARSTVAESG